ncbi:hypothetical protein [Aliidiomarina sp.]|uniref:hypothetical protein n=1 Tax=Aliidiomarina sp. TaxID=1872439 RepID=UPI003A4D210D
MANFIRPFAQRLQAKRKQMAIEITVVAAVAGITMLWLWWQLPPALSHNQQQTIARANTPQPILETHRVAAQLNLLQDIAVQLALVPAAELTDIEITGSQASVHFVVQNSASAHRFNQWQFRNWQLSKVRLHSHGDDWQVNLQLTLQ